MPTSRKKQDLGRVRIPADLNREFDAWFSAFQMRILHEAVVLAATRGAQMDDFYLRPEDLVTATAKAFLKAATEFKKTFAARGSRYVRKAS